MNIGGMLAIFLGVFYVLFLIYAACKIGWEITFWNQGEREKWIARMDKEYGKGRLVDKS